MKEILLFLSAFIPMYFLIIVKLIIEIINTNLTFNFLNTTVLIVMLSVIGLGLLGLRLEIYNKKQKSDRIIIIKYENITDQHFLGYFSLFVLFAITFDLSKYSMFVVFVLIISMIGVVYVKNKLFYINPFLNILGYNFYNVTYKIVGSEQTKITKLFFKGDLVCNKEYLVKIKNEHFSFVDKQKDGLNWTIFFIINF